MMASDHAYETDPEYIAALRYRAEFAKHLQAAKTFEERKFIAAQHQKYDQRVKDLRSRIILERLFEGESFS